MRVLAFTPFLAAAFLTSCNEMPSIEGVATEQNTLFDPALVGSWAAEYAVVVSQKVEEKNYRISWINVDETDKDAPLIVHMEAKLVQLGDQRILDVIDADPGPFSIACHVFIRVWPADGGLKFQFVDSKWIRAQLKASSLPSFMADGHPVINAPASQVSDFLLKYGFDARAMDDDAMMLHPLKEMGSRK